MSEHRQSHEPENPIIDVKVGIFFICVLATICLLAL